jgi:hypothetical protein
MSVKVTQKDSQSFWAELIFQSLFVTRIGTIPILKLSPITSSNVGDVVSPQLIVITLWCPQGMSETLLNRFDIPRELFNVVLSC